MLDVMTRTIVVTGANRGIGYAVVSALASHPQASSHRIVMVCRDTASGALARDALAQTTQAELVLVPASLDDIRSIRAAAEHIGQACPRIDALIHNAGVWPARLIRNTDGLEHAFVVNHLAPFLLNRCLEHRLAESKARVVQVSAGLYVKGKVDLERTKTGDDFSALTTYATTKLCNLLLLGRFAERFRPLGVTINAVHPGVIRTGLGDRGDLLGVVLKLVKRLWKEPEQAAPPILRLTLDPALASTTGRYFDGSTEQALLPIARDAGLADALWQQAEALTGLSAAADVTTHASNGSRVAG
jgi:NAD(P)-dependent dehydrogenase (short-subunit alcohol dehydrogenase family)